MLTETKEYTTGNRLFFRVILALWIIMLALVNIAFGVEAVKDPSTLPTFLFGLPCSIWAIAYFYFLLEKRRLVISKRGITYHTVWFITSAKWGDLETIKEEPLLLWQTVLKLKQANFIKQKLWWTLLIYIPFMDRVWSKAIPLGSINWEKWEEIEATLKQQAPHLFQ